MHWSKKSCCSVKPQGCSKFGPSRSVLLSIIAASDSPFPPIVSSIFSVAFRQSAACAKIQRKRVETLRPEPEERLDPVPSSKSLISGVRIASVDIKLKFDSTPKRDTYHLGAETQNVGQWRRTSDRYQRTSDRYVIRRAHPDLIGRSVWLSAPLLPSSMNRNRSCIIHPWLNILRHKKKRLSPRGKDASS